jgi:hypothetical protein
MFHRRNTNHQHPILVMLPNLAEPLWKLEWVLFSDYRLSLPRQWL